MTLKFHTSVRKRLKLKATKGLTILNFRIPLSEQFRISKIRSKIGQSIQDNIDMIVIVTDGRLNDARGRQIHDPIDKNVMRKQNSFEIIFKDSSKFYAQNPIIGILLNKIGSGKLTNKSVKKCLNKTLNPRDIELNQKLQRLKTFNNNLSTDNDSDDYNDGGLPPPPSPHVHLHHQSVKNLSNAKARVETMNE